jgi:hypothetical protein
MGHGAYVSHEFRRQWAKPSNLQLYILAGASNMAGGGDDMEEWPSDVPKSHPNIWTFSNLRYWKAASPMMPRGAIGPGFFFALAHQRNNPTSRIGLVPTANYGSRMSDWKEGEELFKAMIKQIEAAKHAGKVAAFLWSQGETDAQQKDAAESIGQNFTEFVQAVRRNLGDIPIVFAQVGAAPDPQHQVPYWQTVKDQQAAINLPGVTMVKTDDLPNAGLYLTMPGYRALGERFAGAVQ